MPLQSSNLALYRPPVRRHQGRRGSILGPLAQFLAFSDMVVAIGLFLFGIGTLANVKASLSSAAEADMEVGERLVEISWAAISIFACLLVGLWNLLCTMVLFVGVHGGSVVIMRLWGVCQSISLVYSTVVLWSNAPVMSAFHLGFGLALLIHKLLVLVATGLFSRLRSHQLHAAAAARRMFNTSKIQRV